MISPDYAALDTELRSLLGLQVAPIAITFSNQAPPNTVPYDSPVPSLAEVVEKLKATCAADTMVDTYASEDKQRFDV